MNNFKAFFLQMNAKFKNREGSITKNTNKTNLPTKLKQLANTTGNNRKLLTMDITKHKNENNKQQTQQTTLRVLWLL